MKKRELTLRDLLVFVLVFVLIFGAVFAPRELLVWASETGVGIEETGNSSDLSSMELFKNAEVIMADSSDILQKTFSSYYGNGVILKLTGDIDMGGNTLVTSTSPAVIGIDMGEYNITNIGGIEVAKGDGIAEGYSFSLVVNGVNSTFSFLPVISEDTGIESPYDFTLEESWQVAFTGVNVENVKFTIPSGSSFTLDDDVYNYPKPEMDTDPYWSIVYNPKGDVVRYKWMQEAELCELHIDRLAPRENFDVQNFFNDMVMTNIRYYSAEALSSISGSLIYGGNDYNNPKIDLIVDDTYGVYQLDGAEMTVYAAVLNSDNCMQGKEDANGFIYSIRANYMYDGEDGIQKACSKVIFAEGAIPETYTDESGTSLPITMVEIYEMAEMPEFAVGAYELNLTDTVKTVRNYSSTPITVNGNAELWVEWSDGVYSSEVDFSSEITYSDGFDLENGLAKPGSTITIGTVEKINEEDGTSTVYSLGNMYFENYLISQENPQELLDNYVKHYTDGTKVITVPNIASYFSAGGQQIEVIPIDSLAENKYAEYITLEDDIKPSVFEGRDWYNTEITLNAGMDSTFDENNEKTVYQICEQEDGTNTEGNWQTSISVTNEGQDIAKTYVLIDKSEYGIDDDGDGSYDRVGYLSSYGKIIYLNYTYTMDLTTPVIIDVKASDSTGKHLSLFGGWQESDNAVVSETAWTNDPLLLFYVEADAGTGTAITQYGFQFPGETDFTWITSQEKEYEFEADGIYDIYFRVRDSYDENIEDRGTSEMWVTQIGIDTIAPVLEYVDNIAVQGGILTDNSIYEGRLSLTGYDERSGVKEVTLYVEADGTWTQKNDVLISGEASGSYYIEPVSTDMIYRLAVTDMAGNETIYENITLKAKEENVYVTDISLSESSISLKKEDTFQLIATISPEDALNQKLEWTSTDIGVAKVDETGNITAVAEGSATITVTATDGSGVSASCEVTVTDMSQEAPSESEGGQIQTSGKVSLKSGIAYSLGSGKWKVSGDDTVYNGNITFYVSEDGEYEFTLQ